VNIFSPAQLIRDLGFQIFLLRLIGILLAYINVIILANKLNINDFGVFTSVIAFASIVAVALDFGCSGLCMRNVPRIQDLGRRKYLVERYFKIVISSIMLLGIGLLIIFSMNKLSIEVVAIAVLAFITCLLRFSETALKSLEVQRWSIVVGGVAPHAITVLLYLSISLNLISAILIAISAIGLSMCVAVILVRKQFVGINSYKFSFTDVEIKGRDIISSHYDHLSFVFLALLVSLFQAGAIPFLRGVSAIEAAAITAITLRVLVPFNAARSAIIAENTPITLRLLANGDFEKLQNKIISATRSMRSYAFWLLLLTIAYAYVTERVLPETYTGIMGFMLIIAIGQCASLSLGFHQALHASFSLKLRILSMLLVFALLIMLAVGIYFCRYNILYVQIILATALFLRSFIYVSVGRYGLKKALDL